MPSHASTAAEHISMSKEYRHWLPSLLHSRKVIPHYSDVIMGAMVHQITSLTIVYSTVYSSAAQRKRQSCASLDFLCGKFTGHRASNTEIVCTGSDGVSNHQPHHSLLNRLFRRRSKKTSKPHVTGLWAGDSSVTGDFPAQMASNAENVSIW